MIEPNINFSQAILGCGATVVKNLGDPDQDPLQMVKTLLTTVGYRFTFYVMADAQAKKTTKNTSGVKLKKYIEENNLGPIIETQGRHYSEVHQNAYIKVYVWRPDYKNKDFKAWCTANRVRCKDKMW